VGLKVTEPATDATAWLVAQTDAGPVTLATLDALRLRTSQLEAWATKAEASAALLRDQASERFSAAGAILVPRSKEWAVPPTLQASVDRAQILVAQIGDNDHRAEDLEGNQSSGGVFGRLGAWRQRRALRHDRAGETSELRQLLIQIAKAASPPTIPEAQAEDRAGEDLEAQAKSIDQQVQSARTSAELFNQEIGRRTEAIRAMGFDALYDAAALNTSGAQAVDSPLVLKSGEKAYLSWPATLARYVTKTHYVGGSSGFSFPIGHTGIRYRVGAFRGQPVQQQALTKLDVGTFVLTNQRVAFIGHMKSTSIALVKIMHVEVFTDGLSVFQDGRENPDFYLMPGSKRAVFLLNWFLGKQSG
jgi:hypothetical protein